MINKQLIQSSATQLDRFLVLSEHNDAHFGVIKHVKLESQSRPLLLKTFESFDLDLILGTLRKVKERQTNPP